MENSFGSVPPAAGEDGKAPVHIKEELGKEIPSPDGLKPASFFEFLEHSLEQNLEHFSSSWADRFSFFQ